MFLALCVSYVHGHLYPLQAAINEPETLAMMSEWEAGVIRQLVARGLPA